MSGQHCTAFFCPPPLLQVMTKGPDGRIPALTGSVSLNVHKELMQHGIPHIGLEALALRESLGAAAYEQLMPEAELNALRWKNTYVTRRLAYRRHIILKSMQRMERKFPVHGPKPPGFSIPDGLAFRLPLEPGPNLPDWVKP